MKSNEIRSSFLEYFRSKGHTIVPSSSLVPANDPTLLFVNSGIIARDLRAPEEAYEPVREVLLTINEAVANVDVSEAFDGSYLDQLEEMGYFEALGVPSS